MNLTGEQHDRAAGVLLGTAAGDALGAGYEFGPPLAPDVPIAMKGGGTFDWEPGEWTDDTAMSVAIAQVASTGVDLRSDPALDAVCAAWFEWARDASDVGVQTRAVLDAAGRAAAQHGLAVPLATHVRTAAQRHHERTGRSAGNGSLMRTAPLALAYLDDPDALVEAAREVSRLTHWDDAAGDACVLWCSAIRHAVLTGDIDARVGLAALPGTRRDDWAGLLAEAENARPADFPNNGWVVQALQAAWCAITTAPGRQLRPALEAAVRGGNDTDTVAAIAGGLLGAAHGAAAIPADWRQLVHGWPGFHGTELVGLAHTIVAIATTPG